MHSIIIPFIIMKTLNDQVRNANACLQKPQNHATEHYPTVVKSPFSISRNRLAKAMPI